MQMTHITFSALNVPSVTKPLTEAVNMFRMRWSDDSIDITLSLLESGKTVRKNLNGFDIDMKGVVQL